jgi:hypothetical protein
LRRQAGINDRVRARAVVFVLAGFTVTFHGHDHGGMRALPLRSF